MNKTKISNPVRLIAFFLTGVILICTFGFTVDGWQNTDKQQAQQDSDTNNEQGDKTETPVDKEHESENTPEEPEIYIPSYTNRLTGLECSEELASKTPLAFIMDANTDCYGISRAEIICEIPTENDESRLVAFISDIENLWKIGAIAPSRDYISNLPCFFGGITISVGNDDKINYDSCITNNTAIDLSLKSGYHYTEFSKFSYSNCDLINAAIEAAKVNDSDFPSTALPFSFLDFGSEPVMGTKTAKTASLSLNKDSFAEFIFNEDAMTYSINKNGKPMQDALNGESAHFTNCFVLFADSVTYDNAECSQMVMDTVGSGVGYYLSYGTVTEIKWSATTGGVMTFYNESGEKLAVNRGNSYIYYMKSSKVDNVIFS